MVYVRKSRRARREEEEEGDKDAGAVAKEVTSPPAEEELSYRRRRRYANRDAADVETAQTEAAEEREESGSSDRYRRRLERDRYFTQAIVPSAVSTPSPPPSGASPVGNMATTAAGNKLAKEINDEFLTCKICLEGFKTPKCLDCLHTFCEQCIDNHVLSECSYKKYSDYREFTCPLCRKRTQLPIGGVKKLPDNFLVSSLNEVVSRQKPSKYPFCDICKLINRKHREATSKCLDCNKLLCKPCVDMHKETRVTSNHSLFDVEIEKDIECKEHQDEVVRFYCEPCQACICVLCTFNEHKDHEISQFSDAVNKYKETIQALLGDCKGKIDVYDRQLALLNRCEGSIKNTEQRIHDAAIQFIAEVRTKEKALVDELHAVYGKELMQYMERKDEMQTNLDSLKSTCNLTELVLKGKDIELLLLKRQVEEKLSVLANVELKDLPRTIGKQITFVTGSLELGRLDDPDVPSEMKKKGQANSLRNNEENSQKLTLPNMIFGQTRSRDIDTELFLAGGEPDPVRLAPKPIPKRTVDTQTDSPLKQSETTKKTFGNRCIQTEYPERYDNLGFGFSRGHSSSGSQETRGTETDVINTVEKAVNTPTRSLQSLTSQLERSV